jgi:hypothetical protein
MFSPTRPCGKHDPGQSLKATIAGSFEQVEPIGQLKRCVSYS